MAGDENRPAKVLVVEDEPAIRRLLVRLLEEAGHVGVPASDAGEARVLLEKEHPPFELMLCDVTMPGESGLELIRDTLGAHPETAVVMVTGVDDPDTAHTALELGAYGYVTKPFRPNELLINVANALRRRSLELENRMHRERLEQMLDERTAVLRHREAGQRAVASLGQRALYGMDLQTLFGTALGVVREQLDVPLAAVLQLTAERDEFAVAAALGFGSDVVGTRVSLARSFDAGLVVATEEPVTYSEAGVPCAPSPIGNPSHEVRSGLSVLIRLSNGPYGSLTMQAFDDRQFSDDDVSFAQSVANLLGDALARMRSEEQLRDQALRDPLTGLPNRAVLTDRLDYALVRSGRRQGNVAVLFIDLDHFKTVNDSLGHRAGDELLAAVARRMLPLIRSGDTLARFGGDEFVVLCEELPRPAAAVELARRLGEALVEPFTLGTDTVFVTASIGIALTSEQGTSAEALLRDADAAVYLAKDRGRARYEFFDAALRGRAVERMRTETSLRWALDRDELVPYYQPIIDLRDGSIVSFEALVRWNHPERGMLLPEAFIPLCEETGLVVPLGALMLKEACSQLSRWTQSGAVDSALTMNVNVSARQLASPQFADYVKATLMDAELEPRRLRLEITESTLVDGTGRTTETVQRLHDLGVGLVLDDFGTGYSSLGYIQRFPLDCIKLDRVFVAGLGDDPTQRALVGGIISIAQALGLEVVVEGIETKAQADAARELGCHLAQGFLFAHPIGAAMALQAQNGHPPWTAA